MDKKIQHQELKRPDYKRIYQDMISKKFPEKQDLFVSVLEKQNLSFFDVLKISDLVSGMQKKETVVFNQKHKSYDQESIRKILEYQRKNKLNNSQTAIHFKLSRNTISKWKKTFD
ncbi:hypothetical protein GCM10022217_26180 [Chryseobacterium ginsenosidimutans]|uniref:helix-turn-helix domain-containing protein n=1 Tax=Chryseobacterium ginsenosidimutans TaxID=687846 RepID=UPI0031D69D5E